MTRGQATALMREWQSLLGLDGWRIDLKFTNGAEIPCLGRCGSTDSRQMATIEVAWPHPESDNLEGTIIHELLHCYFAATDDDGSQTSYKSVRTEQGVDMVAELLVSLREG